jgi:hypothetical protein
MNNSVVVLVKVIVCLIPALGTCPFSIPILPHPTKNIWIYSSVSLKGSDDCDAINLTVTLDIVHHLGCLLKTRTFQILDLSPSSG